MFGQDLASDESKSYKEPEIAVLNFLRATLKI
jgi:hypothetical protein